MKAAHLRWILLVGVLIAFCIQPAWSHSQPLPAITKPLLDDFIKTYSRLGNHVTGSKIDSQTTKWIEGLLKKFGYNVSLLPVRFQRAIAKESTLVVKKTSSKGETTYIEGMPLLDTQATGPEGINSMLGEEDEQNVVPVMHIYNALDLSDQRFVLKNRRHIQDMINSGRYPAIILVTQGGRIGLSPVNVNLSSIRNTPVILVGSGYGNWLESKSKINNPIRLITNIQRRESVAYNLMAKINGTDPQAKPVVVLVGATSWYQAAAETGSSLAAWYAVAQQMAVARPRRSVFFVMTSGEELDYLGLRQFLKQHADLVQNAYAWVRIGPNVGAPKPNYLVEAFGQNAQSITQRALENEQIQNIHWVDSSGEAEGLASVLIPYGTRYIAVTGIRNECYRMSCDKWPSAISVSAELRIARALNQIVNTLSNI